MPTVLVTGAGRGIGRATALRLAAGGWDVVAGVRRAQDGEALAGEGGERIVPVQLDVTDSDQVAALGSALPARLEGVVNNAGVVVPGPVESVPVDELRRQMEINLIGQAAVTQAVMKQVRAARGRVVFVSSLSGRVATPMMGAYNASKFALEGLADSLRMEVRPWGVRVVLVEPGAGGHRHLAGSRERVRRGGGRPGAAPARAVPQAHRGLAEGRSPCRSAWPPRSTTSRRPSSGR